jgi:hypothetical protein
LDKNFVIFATGRGSTYAFMLTCDEETVTSRVHNTMTSGFEVFIYTIEPNPTGSPGFIPQGAVHLKRIWHLYDAHDEFLDDAESIINRLSCHSVEASREYLDLVLEKLQAERARLDPIPANPTTGS